MQDRNLMLFPFLGFFTLLFLFFLCFRSLQACEEDLRNGTCRITERRYIFPLDSHVSLWRATIGRVDPVFVRAL